MINPNCQILPNINEVTNPARNYYHPQENQQRLLQPPKQKQREVPSRNTT
jgi:hypothetical protein